MPRLSAAALALLLAGCATAPEAPGLRDTRVPVRSLATFDLSRLSGTWSEAAHLARPGTAPCPPGQLTIRPDGTGLRLDGRLCLGGRAQTVAARAVAAGPGRLAVAGFAEPWWLIWADDSARTAVLATPSGAFAVVLDRGRIAPDRLRAAREVLAFNGYPVAALR